MSQDKIIYRYQAFGLKIDSEFEIFQLFVREQEDKADVCIAQGEVPEYIKYESHHTGRNYQIIDGNVGLYVKDLANFWMSDGDKITVQLYPDADLQAVNLYILGTCLGAILHQRGDLVLHGNAVRMGDKAVIVVAQSGVGKSTLAGEFYRRGYQLLADDVCTINQAGFVQPSYPYLKLWQASLDKLNFMGDDLIKIRLHTDKYYFPLKTKFCATPLKVSAIYVLNKGNNKKVIFTKIKGIKKLVRVMNNKYRPEFAYELKLRHLHIQHFSKLLKSVKVSQILRPTEGFELESLASIIIEDLDVET